MVFVQYCRQIQIRRTTILSINYIFLIVSDNYVGLKKLERTEHFY